MILRIREVTVRSWRSASLRCNVSIIGRFIGHDGAGGQGFYPPVRIIPYRVMAAFVIVPLPSGCAGNLEERLQAGGILPWMGLQGRWVGPVIPTGPVCGPTATGLMSIGPTSFAFDPFQSTTVIRGEIDPTGNLKGAAVRANAGHGDI